MKTWLINHVFGVLFVYCGLLVIRRIRDKIAHQRSEHSRSIGGNKHSEQNHKRTYKYNHTSIIYYRRCILTTYYEFANYIQLMSSNLTNLTNYYPLADNIFV